MKMFFAKEENLELNVKRFLKNGGLFFFVPPAPHKDTAVKNKRKELNSNLPKAYFKSN